MGIALCFGVLSYGACQPNPRVPAPPSRDDGGTFPRGGGDAGSPESQDAGTSTLGGSPEPTLIRTENALPGNPEWKLTRTANQGEIEGYALLESVAAGDKVPIAVSVNTGHPFSWSVYRLGYYGGAGARELGHGGPIAGVPQPACPLQSDTGLVACAWPAAFELQTGASWVRGVYLVKLTRDDGFQRYVPFVLHDGATPQVLVSLPTGTWQAYNTWGGESLYDDEAKRMPGGRAFKVSYDRPYVRDQGAGDLLTHDRSLITWLEAQGLDVGYATTGDLDRAPTLLKGTGAFIVSGHDEYWTSSLRDAADGAVARGTSLLLLGANAAYWHVRLEPSADGRDRRVITCYKDDAPQRDPVGPTSPRLTVKFRNPPINRPESRLFGVMLSKLWNQFAFPAVITNPNHWALAGTGLGAGDTLWRSSGYEADSLADSSPSNEEVLASSPVLSLAGLFGHSQMVVRQQGRALVFAAGGIDFVSTLSGEDAADPRAQRLVANVLYRALGRSVPEERVQFGPAPLPPATGPFATSVQAVAGVPGSPGDQDGPAGSGRLLAPTAVAVLPGGALAVLDAGAGKVKRVAPDGTIQTLPTGPFTTPLGLAADAQGNLYVSDSTQNIIWQLRPDGTGSVLAGSAWSSGLVDGPGLQARFASPAGLALAPDGSLLVADTDNGLIRRVDLRSPDHRVTRLASSEELYRPTGVTAGPDGTVYVVETGKCRVVALNQGQLQVLAGGEPGFADGAPPRSRLLPYLGIALLPDRTLAVSDPGNYRVRRIGPGGVGTLAGSGHFGHRDGGGDQADLVLPSGMAAGPDGTLYLADTGNGAIRAIHP